MKFYGNERIISELKQIVRLKKILHCYLFYGDDGVGKKTIAKFFAKSICCGDNNAPCNNCISCFKFESDSYVDFVEIGDKKDSLKQSFNVETVRDLIEDSFVKPNEGNFKIFLLSDIDDLLTSSSNALLKILEEPPENVIFILTAKSRYSILETIFSRCCSFFVAPWSWQDFLDFAKENDINISEVFLREIFELSGGRIGSLKFFLESKQNSGIIDISKKMFDAILKNKEFEFNHIISLNENDVETTLKILDCVLFELSKLIENSDLLSLEEILKFSRISNIIEVAIYNLKKGGKQSLNLAAIGCRIFSLLV